MQSAVQQNHTVRLGLPADRLAIEKDIAAALGASLAERLQALIVQHSIAYKDQQKLLPSPSTPAKKTA